MKKPDPWACYDYAHAVLREQKIRANKLEPINQREWRWWKEGPRPTAKLDTLQEEPND